MQTLVHLHEKRNNTIYTKNNCWNKARWSIVYCLYIPKPILGYVIIRDVHIKGGVQIKHLAIDKALLNPFAWIDQLNAYFTQMSGLCWKDDSVNSRATVSSTTASSLRCKVR